MRRLLPSLLFLSFVLAVSPSASAEGLVGDEIEISEEIIARATDPYANAFPKPWFEGAKAEPTRSSLFYALPMIGFWLILRRRGRGIRL